MAEKFKPTWSTKAINDSAEQLKKRPGFKKSIAADAPRVLKLIKNKWEIYIKLVDEQSYDHTLTDEVIEKAKDTATNFYVFVIEKVNFRRIHSKKDTPDTLTVWRKMPRDARLLYNNDFQFFEKVFAPELVRDFLREKIPWPF
jgi:hypothetical protein